MQWSPTRAAGLERLAEFLPRAGRDYAATRNCDDGVPTSGARRNVSQLSPWLHAGLLREAEVIAAVLSRHNAGASEKFVSEVFWRIYFKGFLEQRPGIWRAYCDGRERALAALDGDPDRAAAYARAVGGMTGIAAFDHWARELAATGYLHNHARMWFASIWIFTLRLDWELGADVFLRHLIDGDAASNTLSWRWVGGLHTKGKTYLARADNIAHYTANRPGGPLTAKGLASAASPLEEPTEHPRSRLNLPQAADAAWFDQPFALLLHDEAASHAPLALPRAPALVIGAARPDARSPRAIGEHADSFARTATAHAVAEAAAAFGCPERSWDEGGDLAGILDNAGIARLVLPYLPVGWTRDALMPALAPLIEQGRVTFLLGDLARTTWPHATAGFFGVKKQIDAILEACGIAGVPRQPLLL